MKRKQLVAGIMAVLLAFAPIQSARAEGGIALDTAHFPDKKFREYVSKKFDTNKDGLLSKDEIGRIGVIDCSNKGIRSLSGIEYFTWLECLSCNKNKLSKLDVSRCRCLERLDCSENKLTKLDVSKNRELLKLYCGDNKLTKLNVSKNVELWVLNCENNRVTKLNVRKNTELYELRCSKNKIKKLDVRRNETLERLYCDNNKLTKLDLRRNWKLDRLRAYKNKLRRVDLAKGNVSVINWGWCYRGPLSYKGQGKNLTITVATEDDLVWANELRVYAAVSKAKIVIRKKK